MKNWIEKKITAWAGKINEREQKEKAARDEMAELYRKKTDDAKKLIMQWLDNYKMKDPHIAVGDPVVLNKYSLGRNGYNGWDSGPRHIISCEKNDYVLFGRVISIEKSMLYAEELASRYVDKHHINMLSSILKSGVIHILYRSYVRSNKVMFSENYGLYWNVKVELENGMTYELNADSFLHTNSAEGIATIRIWRLERETIKLNGVAQLKSARFQSEKQKCEEMYPVRAETKTDAQMPGE